MLRMREPKRLQGVKKRLLPRHALFEAAKMGDWKGFCMGGYGQHGSLRVSVYTERFCTCRILGKIPCSFTMKLTVEKEKYTIMSVVRPEKKSPLALLGHTNVETCALQPETWFS